MIGKSGTEDGAGKLPTLLVIASTYPRWSGDHEPGFVHELARRLTTRFRVTVLCPHAEGAEREAVLDGVHVRRFRYAPVRLQRLVNDGGIVANLKRNPLSFLLVPGFVLSQAWQGWRLCRNGAVDVVHAHWFVPQGLVCALTGLLPGRHPGLLVTSHGADTFALRGPFWDRIRRFVVNRASAVSVVSEDLRNSLARAGIDTGGIRVMPMGVDLVERFTPDPAQERLSDELLFVGRLVEKKGLRHLLDAMPAILHQRPNTRLTIAGFGPELPALRRQVQLLGIAGHVQFLGPVAQDDLPALYRRATAFVAPFVQALGGDREGLGLVSVEAAGCGCPVVVSNLPAVRQAFPDDDLARLVPPGDAAALASACVAVLADAPGAAAMAARARAHLLTRFDWTQVALRYGDLIASVARR